VLRSCCGSNQHPKLTVLTSCRQQAMAAQGAAPACIYLQQTRSPDPWLQPGNAVCAALYNRHSCSCSCRFGMWHRAGGSASVGAALGAWGVEAQHGGVDYRHTAEALEIAGAALATWCSWHGAVYLGCRGALQLHTILHMLTDVCCCVAVLPCCAFLC
jgi:hypothetical protein